MKKQNIVIATIKSWNIDKAQNLKRTEKHKYKVFIIKDKGKLTYKNIKSINPLYIFFPHWSWFVPKSIFQNFKCIVFHMTDLPYGRGGSPLQNLILRKIYNTKISAIKVENNLDSGKVYLKEDLYIGAGSAEEIFKKAAKIIFSKMIPHILKHTPVARKQSGRALNFRRRIPSESNIASIRSTALDDLYDFIRMLDAEGYPLAFSKINGLKIEFSNVNKKRNKLFGNFEVTDEK